MKATFAGLAFLFLTTAVHAAGSCGGSTVVRQDDTLSGIADRCDVSEREILRANPSVESSGDLRAGQTLRLEAGASHTVDDALKSMGSAARESAQALGSLANNFKSSVSDLLDKNPDLRNRLDSLRRTVTGAVAPGRDAAISVAVASDRSPSQIHVTGSGLPGERDVVIGLGKPRAAYDLVGKARTTAKGDLDVTIPVPTSTPRTERLVAVVGGVDRDWTIRSEPFLVSRP